MTRLFDYLLEAIRSPREQLSRGQQFVRQSWELAIHCYRQLQRQRAEGMAAELTYRSIFALIPVVVLGLVMFRIVGGLDEVQGKVENQLFSFFGVPEIPDSYISENRFNDGERDKESETSTDAASEPTPSRASQLKPSVTGDRSTEGSQANNTASNDSEILSPSPGAPRIPIPVDPSDSNVSATLAPALEDTTSATPGDAADRQKPKVAALPAGNSPASEKNSNEADSPEDAEAEAAAIEATARGTRASIRKTLHDLTDKVASVDFASIGVFGLLLFVYAAVALADAVEHLFNRIYDAPSQRPIHIRLAIHWSIITLGSGLLAMSLYMSGQVVEWFDTLGASTTLKWILSHVLSVAASWILLFLLYALMPNTHVAVRAAAIGSGVGSLLWEAAKYGFQLYVAKAVPYSLYGSIGLIPLFLFWIYITWLIVLFGLILTYTLQSFGGRLPRRFQWDERILTAGDPDWMLPIMCEVGHAFDAGDAINSQRLADGIGLSSRIVHELTTKLIEAGLLRKVSVGAAEDDSLTLARPAEKIEIVEILDLAHRVRPTSDHPAWKTLSNLKQAERDAAAGKTLADVQSW